MSEKTFVIFVSLIVGILGGLAALLLKTLIHLISSALTSHLSITGGNWLFSSIRQWECSSPLCLCAMWCATTYPHGVTRVLHAISQNKSRLKRHNTYTSLVASSITIGFGGSVGAEGPIVYTGAAIGSTLGSWLRMSPGF